MIFNELLTFIVFVAQHDVSSAGNQFYQKYIRGVVNLVRLRNCTRLEDGEK